MKRVEIGPCVLYQGDSLRVLKELPDGSADMIFTDPPYGHQNLNGKDLASNIRRALGDKKATPHMRPIANDGEEACDLFRACLPHFKRLLSRGGCCCCCCGGGGPDPQFARWSLWLDEVFHFKQMVIWDKGKMGMGWHYRRSYETVLVAEKKGGKSKWYDDSHKVENIIRPGDYGIKKIIPRADQHPTQKPVELAGHFIRLHTLPGETVLDPFMGSGSTILAAVRQGRRAIGIELDKAHFKVACKRIKAELVKLEAAA